MKTNKTSFKQNLFRLISTIIWVYKFIFKVAPFDAFQILLLNLITSFTPALSIYISSRLLNEVVKVITNQDLSSILSITSPLILILLGYALVDVIDSETKAYAMLLEKKFELVHKNKIEHMYYQKAVEIEISQHEMPSIADILSRASLQKNKILPFFINIVVFFNSLFKVIISGVILVQFSPVLIVLTILFSLPANAAWNSFINKYKVHKRNTAEKERHQKMIGVDLLSEKFLPEHLVGNITTFFFNRLAQFHKEIEGAEYKLRVEKFFNYVKIDPFFALDTIISSLVIIYEVIRKSLTFGDYTFYINISTKFSNGVTDLVGLYSTLLVDSMNIEDLIKYFGLKNQMTNGTIVLDPKEKLNIEFRNVSFKYPGSSKYSLRNINLTINSTDEVAIVGENGAGKTTLTKLILRFYDPTSGEILINGINLKEIEKESYYKHIGLQFQEYNTYRYLTIEGNIAIGNPNTKIKREKIIEAAKAADAHDFINQLPLGYDHLMFRNFTNGVNLSTGQKQKIALARMFYRNSPILILDEPTASIDAIAEDKIFKRIFQFMNNKMVIIISHRFSTVRNAKKIYVLSKGRLVEFGSHVDLMKLKGIYHTSFTLQAKGYQEDIPNEEEKDITE